MVRVGCFAFFAVMLLGSTADADDKPFFCSMALEQVNNSPDCLRYYMSCIEDEGFVSPIFKDLKPKDLLIARIESRALIAAEQCRKFSYQEALSAVRLLSP